MANTLCCCTPPCKFHGSVGRTFFFLYGVCYWRMGMKCWNLEHLYTPLVGWFGWLVPRKFTFKRPGSRQIQGIQCSLKQVWVLIFPNRSELTPDVAPRKSTPTQLNGCTMGAKERKHTYASFLKWLRHMECLLFKYDSKLVWQHGVAPVPNILTLRT